MSDYVKLAAELCRGVPSMIDPPTKDELHEIMNLMTDASATIRGQGDQLARLTAALHAHGCHPEFSYCVTPHYPITPPFMGEWEPNPEYPAAPGDVAWRRRKETP